MPNPENPNYAAIVVEIKNTMHLANCDNVVAAPILGYQAIVSKDTRAGTIGLFFPAEVRLSEEYCRENNLFRHANLNKNPDKTGYIEDNRRVKAVKFRGNRSDCLFMPLSSLEWTGEDLSTLSVGDTFDTLGGKEICRKYVVKTRESKAQQKQKKAFKRVDKKYLPEHYDSEHYLRNEDKIDPMTELVITQKLHGTSIRIGNTIVARELNFVEKALKFLGVKIKDTEFDYVFGSRKVIKDVNNPNQEHFYETDIWTEEGKKLEGLIPENFVLYGELVGWTPNGAEIQKNYTYGIEQGKCELYIYRVAFVNSQGVITDLSWDQVKEFCKQRGIKYVPEVHGRIPKEEFDVYDYLDERLADSFALNTDLLKLGSNKKLVDEGVCVRVEGLVPTIYKAKSPLFLEHESKMLDKEVTDIEAEQSESEE